jgi:hypothetical protein
VPGRAPGRTALRCRRPWVAEATDDPAAGLPGSVALKEVTPTHLELKTTRVTASGRGRGLGRCSLDHALHEARAAGALAARPCPGGQP